MRQLTRAAVAATTVLGAGAAAVAAGRRAAGAALRPDRSGSGGAPVPAGFEGATLTVHSVDSGRIGLTRSHAARLPGRYALTGRGCRALIGPVLEEATEQAGAGTVVRRLDRIIAGDLVPGTRVQLTPELHDGDPREALGLDCADLKVSGELGPLPAWCLPGDHATWTVAAHGLGATLAQPLNLFPFFERHRLPLLDVGYRGDPAAPAPADGFGHLGDTEWPDLDAAVRHALDHGAQQVILYGWSTGATMALHTVAHSEHRDQISGLVLDSPVLDRRATLRALAAGRHVPRFVLPLAERAARARTGVPEGWPVVFDDPVALKVPTLIFHGPADTVAPCRATYDFAQRHPDLVTFQEVPEAAHAAMWNADPDSYEESLRRFLVSLM
jgi:dienelactone hydrolase